MDAVYAASAAPAQPTPPPSTPLPVNTVEQIAAIAKSAIVLDVRGGDEITSLGNAISGHVNIAYSDDQIDKFLQQCQMIIPNKETPIIAHWNKGGRSAKAKGTTRCFFNTLFRSIIWITNHLHIIVAFESLGYKTVMNGVSPSLVQEAIGKSTELI